MLSTDSKTEGDAEPAAEPSPKKKKRVMGPSRVGPSHLNSVSWECVGAQFEITLNPDVSPQPPVQLSGQYPQHDPDYSVWLPPAGKQAANQLTKALNHTSSSSGSTV